MFSTCSEVALLLTRGILIFSTIFVLLTPTPCRSMKVEDNGVYSHLSVKISDDVLQIDCEQFFDRLEVSHMMINIVKIQLTI